jgi:hypothetical protein
MKMDATIATFCMALGMTLGYLVGVGNVTDDCRMMGQFRSLSNVYSCEEVKKK